MYNEIKTIRLKKIVNENLGLIFKLDIQTIELETGMPLFIRI